ncbi:MAG: hypothetical protein IKN96_00635 [Oscillibacter sp.]|nr:hypothetical protein [Oscillibacter sp.]
MVKTMKRGFSLMFVLSLLVSMLVMPAEATNGSKSVTVRSSGKSTQYATIYTDRSFMGWKTTTVTVRNTSRNRTIALYNNIGRIGYAYAGNLTPGRSKTFSAKANGTVYSFMVQRAGGRGDATVQFTIKNGY